MYQNFCKSLGYGAKGYYLLNKDFKSKKKTILISGTKQNYKYLISKLTKIFKAKPRHIIIKKERFDLNTIDKFGPDGISKIIKYISNKAIRFQTGYIYDYAFVMLIGLSALITFLIIN